MKSEELPSFIKSLYRFKETTVVQKTPDNSNLRPAFLSPTNIKPPALKIKSFQGSYSRERNGGGDLGSSNSETKLRDKIGKNITINSEASRGGVSNLKVRVITEQSQAPVQEEISAFERNNNKVPVQWQHIKQVVKKSAQISFDAINGVSFFSNNFSNSRSRISSINSKLSSL